jgi:hypothetical protein
MEEDSLKTMLQFILMGGTLILFLFKLTFPNSVITSLLKWILIILGVIYTLYKGLNMDNPIKQTLFFIGAFLLIILILGYNHLFQIGECNLNYACNENQFCGADHICHDFPEYKNQIIKVNVTQTVDLTFAGFIIGISLIISAIILRKTSFYSRLTRAIFRTLNIIKTVFKK